MRTVEFIPSGSRILATPQQVYDTWKTHSSWNPRYALGTGTHETDLTTNEKDTEDSGFVSMGLYQVSKDEMTHVGMPEANPYDLDECTIVFAKLTDERAQAIMRKTGVYPPSLTPDFNAYLYIAHNQGLAACLKTIALHGLDWARYKQRNMDAAQQALDGAQSAEDVAAATTKIGFWRKVCAYGDDCITGGPHMSQVQL